MHCPCCPGSPLLVAERLGVEIDRCPHCQGVWLDAGELDRLIEVAASPTLAHVMRRRRETIDAGGQGGARGWAQRPRPRRSAWLGESLD